MTEKPQPDRETGKQLLSAVERLVAPSEEIIALVRRVQRGEDEDVHQVAPRLISHYSNKAALGGGATAIPAMVPGLGTLATLVVGPLADMVLLLKWETELCLALATAYGYDIRRPKERQLAMLLAAVSTASAAKGESVFRDAAIVSGTAIWNYTPRRIAKSLVTAMAIVAAIHWGRVGFKALPVIGVAVGASMNKLLSRRVGKQANKELALRRRLDGQPAPGETMV